jgi:hypothetical protein
MFHESIFSLGCLIEYNKFWKIERKIFYEYFQYKHDDVGMLVGI